MAEKKILHICEVCGKTEWLTPDEAFDKGWDYPPRMGAFGVLSPRTCGSCGIEGTVWWALMVEKRRPEELTEAQLAVVARVAGEPGSIVPAD